MLLVAVRSKTKTGAPPRATPLDSIGSERPMSIGDDLYRRLCPLSSDCAGEKARIHRLLTSSPGVSASVHIAQVESKMAVNLREQ